MKVRDTVRTLMTQGKGILAADESPNTIGNRFTLHGIENTEETRRTFRELLFTTPGVERYLSGAILHEETFAQAMHDGTPFTQFLFTRNILAGIKVDTGLEREREWPDGGVTQGLEGLGDRLRGYKAQGAYFTKWRATAAVDMPLGAPSVRENAARMAAYAEAALNEGLVPMVEPEVLMDGTHSASQAEDALVEVISVFVDALHARSVDLKNIILKTSMAVSGIDATVRATPDEVAERTVRALTAAVPDEIGGVAFLSGGQTPEEAAANLNAISRTEPLPWDITFSFSRALQQPVLERWGGKAENASDAQSIFLERVSLAVLADAGGYSKSQEEGALGDL